MLGTQKFNASAIDTLSGQLDLGASPFGIFGGDGWSLVETNLADVAVYSTALKKGKVTAEFAASGYSRPGVPGEPIATAGANSATVTWGAAPTSDPSVATYVVSAVASGSSKPTLSVSVPAGATSGTLTGLKGGTSYKFEVQAVNDYGAGSPVMTAGSVTPSGPATTYASTVLGE